MGKKTKVVKGSTTKKTKKKVTKKASAKKVAKTASNKKKNQSTAEKELEEKATTLVKLKEDFNLVRATRNKVASEVPYDADSSIVTTASARLLLCMEKERVISERIGTISKEISEAGGLK